MELYDPLDQEFYGKVRDYRWISGEQREGGEVLGFTEGKAYIDAEFNLKIFDRLHDPALIGVERIYDGDKWLIILEVARIYPYHLEMGSLDPSVPPLLKEDALTRIRESWIEGGENWMTIEAIHTGYMLRISGSGKLEITRKNLSPLIGEAAHLLHRDVYSELINKGDIAIGLIKGYEVPAKISTYPLYRYHTGFFGYTGTGKSNLVSMLLRRTLEENSGLAAVVIDSTGEYPANIIDLLHRYGVIYLDPTTPIDRFVETVVYPETLEDILRRRGLDVDVVKEVLKEMAEEGRIRHLSPEPTILTPQIILDTVLSERDKITPIMNMQITNVMRRINEYLNTALYLLKESNPDVLDELNNLLTAIKNSISSKTNLYRLIESIQPLVTSPPSIDDDVVKENPYTLARDILYPSDRDAPRLYLIYSPEIATAAILISKLVKEVFNLKKRVGLGREVLFVVDEAHEYIPRDARGYTNESNKALELLFRQGRKYRAGGWIATQRVAHLNTNILQQLHSYFISNLPRSYDRSVVADTFSVSKSLVDRVVMFERGEWLFISHVATKYPNVPVALKTPNNEEEVAEYLARM